ncbi:hypothetical protein [Saccharopolyspora kobensis]|uniref:hypothetical protein n=1 Tax=Saccharopolyspora kobensis TaxID=146035 RepID=UPI0015A648EA|nr:hypothetical protein [Saccharopolyspora kobensis]
MIAELRIPLKPDIGPNSGPAAFPQVGANAKALFTFDSGSPAGQDRITPKTAP